MSAPAYPTAVEAALARSRWLPRIIVLVLAAATLVGLVVIGFAVTAYLRFTRDTPVAYVSDSEHFKYGSIGAERSSGVPFWVWQALPRLFPEQFGNRLDYAAFGFLYENEPGGGARELPIGIARRDYRGIDMVWFNCATCHTGTWRADAAAPRQIVVGMPSNNLDLGRFVGFLLEAASDQRLNADTLIPAMEQAGARFNVFDRLLWRYYIVPQVRDGLLTTRSRLLPLIVTQPPWHPGRVDTFNPYKMVQFRIPAADLSEAERVGVSDFPSVFLQGPRERMQLHWDGNNDSLAERNLSAALGAGVTPETVDHQAVNRIARYLGDLTPPPSPLRPNPAAAARGRALYMEHCAACHGYQDGDRYVFQGARLGRVEPIEAIGTDRSRLDSYTPELQRRQVSELFAGTEHRFQRFVKTNGYANHPLDGLWLRAPYLHNGAVPTLADLLRRPEERPVAFVRGLDIVDHRNGGFLAPACDPATPPQVGQCFDTRMRGNGNGGHVYGTDLPQAARDDLLAYLMTF